MFIVANQSVFKLIICSSHLKDISSNFTKQRKSPLENIIGHKGIRHIFHHLLFLDYIALH